MSKKKRILRSIAFLLITLLLLMGLSEGMKGNEVKAVCNVKGYYQEEKNSLDAVLIGASEVYASYSGIKAWEEFGYTSFSYACPSLRGELYQTMLAEALRTQRPQVVAFEVNGFLHGDDYAVDDAKTRNLLDNLRWSKNRVEAIRKFIPEGERMSYYLPLMAYHGNWSHPGSMIKNIGAKGAMALHGRCVLKGYSGASDIRPYKKQVVKGTIEFTEKSRQDLRDLMACCKEQGIPHVLFFRAPHVKIMENPEVLEEVRQEVEDFGYDWLDMGQNIQDLGYEVNRDFYNAEHLNYYGMQKFTHSLGTLFTEEYGIRGEHSEKTREEWNLCARKAEEVFTQIQEDLEAGVVRSYCETAVYWKPVIIENKEE